MATAPLGNDHRSRLNGDAGAVIVEFAMILPVVITLLMALYEGGVWFLYSNRLGSALQMAGRTDANQGNARLADNAAVLTLRASMQSVKNISIEYVIIYNAAVQDASGRALPDTVRCINKANTYPTSAIAQGDTTAGRECNIYTWGGQVTAANEGSQTPGFTGAGTCDASAWDRFYCPTNRKNGLSGVTSPPDFVGIWIQGNYTSVTKLLGFSSKRVTDYAVFKVEPAPGS